MAVVTVYMPSPLFPLLSDNDTWRALGWDRDGQGGWNAFLHWCRGWAKALNRTLLDPAFIRPFFVASAGMVAILTTAPWRADKLWKARAAAAYNLVLAGLLAFGIWILARKLSLGSDVLFLPETVDIVAAMCGVAVIAELVRRLAGWLMFGLVVLAVLYMKWGAPAWLFYQTTDKTWELLAMNFWLETSGAMGLALSIMIQNVVIFILFGVVIQATGTADALLKIALVATRRLRGGPAHAASHGRGGVLPSGAGPDSLRPGRHRGAAARAVLFRKPVRGGGVPRAQNRHPDGAARRGSIAVPRGLDPLARLLRADRRDHLLPVGRVLGKPRRVLGDRRDSSVRPAQQRIPPQSGKLRKGGIAVAQLLSIVARLGVFIGVVGGTGLGPKIGSDLALLVEESLLAALVLTMLASLVLSMGMPTLPAYATVITIMGIFLSQLAGDATPLMAVRLFVLYFSVLSPVTPPVALAAYAAASIAGAHPFETGITAVLLCAVAFVVPFAFFFHPQLLLGQTEFDAAAFLAAAGRLGLCVWLLTTATAGWAARDLPPWSRVLRAAAAIGLLAVGAAYWAAALAAAIALIGSDVHEIRRRAAAGRGNRQRI